jgi:hypothetical protein
MAPRTYLVGGGRFELPFRRIILSATTRWSARLDSNQQQPASETSARNPSAGRHAMVETARVELASPGCKPSVLRLNDVPGARRRNRTGHDTLCRRAPNRSACRANWSGSRDSNSHIRSGAPVPNPSARPAQPWYPVLDSNQPVRVRSAESSSRGRGKHLERATGFEPAWAAWEAVMLPAAPHPLTKFLMLFSPSALAEPTRCELAICCVTSSRGRPGSPTAPHEYTHA